MATKHVALLMLATCYGASALAIPSKKPEDGYFNDADLVLSEQEKAGIAIAKGWKSTNKKAAKPVPGADGSISFLYGASQPSIVCAVLQVCDVELQPGEQVNSIHLGDSARWKIEPAITGYSDNEVQHLIIKPLDVGLTTSLIVTTNRRTYHLQLRSAHEQYMPRVTFVYPEEAVKKWETAKASASVERSKKTIPATGEYLDHLDFNYRLDGEGSWKPLRVYNDGKKTILEMPSTMAQSEAPTLLIVRKDGGLLSDDEQVMVNYRIQNDRYIVDSLFDKAILIAGVGSSQSKVTITKGK